MASPNPFSSSPFQRLTDEQEAQAAAELAKTPMPVKISEQPEPKAEAVPAASPSSEETPTPRRRAKSDNYTPPAELRQVFDASAQAFDVPVNVLMALAHQESRYNPSAVGVKTEWGRAKGMMQYLDDTAAGLGINPFDPNEAIPAAAKQIRERLDKGYSMEDAVKEHFAGPDRKKWGEKTAAYGREVMEKVGKIGEMVLGEQPRAEAGPDLAALQQQLDAEEPGRYKVMPEGYDQTHFSPATMPRDVYQQNFVQMNPGASDAALQHAMDEYDQQAQARAAQDPAADRFKTLQSPEATFDARLNQKLQGQPNGVVPPLPGKLQPQPAEPAQPYNTAAAESEGALSAAASYLGKSFKSGMYDLAGVGAKVLDEINPWTLSPSDAAVLFKDDPAKLEQLQNDSAAMVLSRFAKRMSKSSEESMTELSDRAKRDYGSLEYATTDTDKAAYMSPTKVIGDVVRSLPTTVAMAFSIYLTKGAAARAEQSALAAGMTPELAKQAAVAAGAKAMATAGAASEGMTGYAQQANQSSAEAGKVPMAELAKSPRFQELLQQGYTLETARAQIIADTGEQAGQIAGIVDAAVNAVGGEFLGKILTEGGKLIPRIMKGAANESATELVQSAGEQVGENRAKQQNINPQQSLSQGVGEAAVGGAVAGAVMGGVAAGAGGAGPAGAAEQAPAPAADIPAPRPTPASKFQPVPAAAVPAAPRSSTPLTSAVEGAAEQPARVVVSNEQGSSAVGTVRRYQEDGQGGFAAEIVGDDGQVYTITDEDGVQLTPVEPAPGPLTAALEAAAEEHAAAPAAQEQQAVAEVAVQTQAEQEAPAEDATEPAQRAEPPAIVDMSDEQLRARLKYIASQAKESGWDKRFVAARREVEAEINKRATAQGNANAKPIRSAAGNDGGGSGRLPARNGGTDGGRPGADRPLPGYEGGNAIVDGAQAEDDIASANTAADAQPALTESADWKISPYHAYSFSDQKRADAFMAKKAVDASKFEVKQTGPVRWQVVPKEGAPVTPQDKLAAADAKYARQDALIQQASENAVKRKAMKAVAGKKIDAEWTAFKPETGTLDIPRAQMPQVKSEHRGAMVNFLNARGIEHEAVEVPAGKLKPTQREFSAEKVQAARDNAGGDRSILISADNHVLDGHHQWLAELGGSEPVKAIRLNAPIRELLDQVHEFPSSRTADGSTKAETTAQPITGEENGNDNPKRKPNGANEVVGQQDAEKASAKQASAEAAQEVESDQQADTGADIPLSFRKKFKVPHEVWVSDEGKYETVDLPVTEALASVREDIDNLRALLGCLKG